MNHIWSIMIIFSIICSFAAGTTEATTAAAFEGAKNGLTALIGIAPLMCFWAGIMNIAQKGGIIKGIKRLMSPIINRLFPNEDEKAREYITMNICANMLGMGSAATPMGIEAMCQLQKSNPHKDRPSKSMCLFMVMNTACFCIVPSTVLSLRSAAASISPESVIPYIWITSFVCVITTVFLVKIFINDHFSV